MAFALKLDKVTGYGEDLLQKESDAISGGNVRVVFEVDGKKAAPESVPLGQTVEYLKGIVDRKHGIPFAAQRLVYKGKQLPDPMSLNDFNIVANSEVVITVKQRKG